MSTKHVRTAADLIRFGAGLRIECRGCGNARTVDGFELAKTLGTGELRQMTKRLKCSRCGVKEAKMTLLSPAAP